MTHQFGNPSLQSIYGKAPVVAPSTMASDYGVAPFKPAQNVYEAVDSPLDPEATRKTVKLGHPLSSSSSSSTYDRVDQSMLTSPLPDYGVGQPTMPFFTPLAAAPQPFSTAASFASPIPHSSPVLAAGLARRSSGPPPLGLGQSPPSPLLGPMGGAGGGAGGPVIDWKVPESPIKSTRMPKPADYEKKVWFKAKFSRDDAVAHLKGKPFGCFVVRPSSVAGCLSISHVEHGGKIGHAVLYIHRGDNGRFGYSIEKSQRTFETLDALLEALPTLSGAEYGLNF